MDVIISDSADKPIYQQLFDQISSQILKGELKAGFALPSIRGAAKELRVSVITVKKAWEELERNGFIYTKVGKGCFVANLTSKELNKMKKDIIEEKMSKDLNYYKKLGMEVEEVIKLVKKLY